MLAHLSWKCHNSGYQFWYLYSAASLAYALGACTLENLDRGTFFICVWFCDCQYWLILAHCSWVVWNKSSNQACLIKVPVWLPGVMRSENTRKIHPSTKWPFNGAPKAKEGKKIITKKTKKQHKQESILTRAFTYSCHGLVHSSKFCAAV